MIIKTLNNLQICDCNYVSLTTLQLQQILPKKKKPKNLFQKTQLIKNPISIPSIDQQLKALKSNQLHNEIMKTSFTSPLQHKRHKTNDHNIKSTNILPIYNENKIHTDEIQIPETTSYNQLFLQEQTPNNILNYNSEHDINIRNIMKEEFVKFKEYFNTNINFDINEPPEQFLYRMRSDKLTVLYGDKNKAKDAQLKVGKIIKSQYATDEENATETLKLLLNGKNSDSNKDLVKKLESMYNTPSC